MTVVIIIGICVVLLVLGFLVPRLSHGPERGTHRAMGKGARHGSKAPGPLGRLISKGFGKSSKAAGTSASAGRSGRNKLPL